MVAQHQHPGVERPRHHRGPQAHARHLVEPLGEGPVGTFLRVVLPQVRPGVVMSGVLAWIISFDQVETTLFPARPQQSTLPIEMFLYLQKWQDPTIAAPSSILILAAAVVVVLSLIGRGRTPQDIPRQGKGGGA